MTEETITEDLLLDYHLLSSQMQRHGLDGIEFFEAVNEPSDGNDLGLIVQYKNAVCYFHIQAKLLDERYQGLWKYHNRSSGRVYQIDQLIQSCPRYINCYPLYLFYNHVWPIEATPATICGHEVDEYQYGCTVADARSILKELGRPHPWKRKPSFSDLHDLANVQTSLAQPWMKLVCCESTDPSTIHNLLRQETTFNKNAASLELAIAKGEITIPFWDASRERELPVTYRKSLSGPSLKGLLSPGQKVKNDNERSEVVYPKNIITVQLEFSLL